MSGSKTFDIKAVIDSAMPLFKDKGYAGTSLSDLEKATKLNKSSELSVMCVPNPYLSVVKRSRSIFAGHEHQTAAPIVPLNI